mmetsp:Transcript_16635/g.22930  ORF Transcript_16635/g.22930 Transcript_16635/m.22930 type:complete len:178 (+) Transcript_16635:78-611(+)|eukprot:CAMPEP_0196585124 /NCGR_PEP_ID=MMETSP1081-20130531/49595_1 /TAXON_ID=36882 /ORGANISM="Pyramimonas amylifera, Strain CCMP720" /LENGTH=177 /DNA_ID=CAMNT_0041906571 /DNA_START=62 /DNA_END=595 /DNA_ORIENTATION=-
MDKHHRLRRDPNWSPHGCNICGQEGHQAANCQNGTVNWREKFGDAAFILKEDRRWEPPKVLDFTQMVAAARSYAQVKQQADARVSADLLAQIARIEFAGVQPIPSLETLPVVAAPAPVAAAPVKAAIPAAAGPWKTYYDNLGRPYYHNAATGKTVWDMPAEYKTAMTPTGQYLPPPQ